MPQVHCLQDIINHINTINNNNINEPTIITTQIITATDLSLRHGKRGHGKGPAAGQICGTHKTKNTKQKPNTTTHNNKTSTRNNLTTQKNNKTRPRPDQDRRPQQTKTLNQSPNQANDKYLYMIVKPHKTDNMTMPLVNPMTLAAFTASGFQYMNMEFVQIRAAMRGEIMRDVGTGMDDFSAISMPGPHIKTTKQDVYK